MRRRRRKRTRTRRRRTELFTVRQRLAHLVVLLHLRPVYAQYTHRIISRSHVTAAAAAVAEITEAYPLTGVGVADLSQRMQVHTCKCVRACACIEYLSIKLPGVDGRKYSLMFYFH